MNYLLWDKWEGETGDSLTFCSLNCGEDAPQSKSRDRMLEGKYLYSLYKKSAS